MGRSRLKRGGQSWCLHAAASAQDAVEYRLPVLDALLSLWKEAGLEGTVLLALGVRRQGIDSWRPGQWRRARGSEEKDLQAE